MARGQRVEIDGSESVPSFYGKELRFQRERAGLTLEQLVEGSYYGATYLSEIERGRRSIPPDLARHVDRVLKTDGYFERRCEEVRRARIRGHADYFQRVLKVEPRAEAIDEWSPTLIPGLLQTEPYMRALFGADPALSPEQIDVMADGRLARADLMEPRRTAPEMWVVLHEASLRMEVVPLEEMADQIEHIIALARRRRIIPQLVPWKVGAHPLMQGNTRMMRFGDAPPLVYTEGPYHGVTVDDPRVVKRYQKSYELLRAVAMSPHDTLDLLAETAARYRKGKLPRCGAKTCEG
ncbi:Scr1 family TA system antitoxin-like transcriptional regulator [Streptomyces sp. NPDC101145]|uniref:helix-turn-helix domain-containing protein n=1 Tax=Streptomyces sp. NPDC101145 TaxID=3366112 RepID=UPI00381DD61E